MQPEPTNQSRKRSHSFGRSDRMKLTKPDDFEPEEQLIADTRCLTVGPMAWTEALMDRTERAMCRTEKPMDDTLAVAEFDDGLKLLDLPRELLMTILEYLPTRVVYRLRSLDGVLSDLADRHMIYCTSNVDSENHWPKLHELVPAAAAGDKKARKQLDCMDRFTWNLDVSEGSMPETVRSLKMLHIIWTFLPETLDARKLDFINALVRVQSTLRCLVVFTPPHERASHSNVLVLPIALNLDTLVIPAIPLYVYNLLEATKHSLKHLILRSGNVGQRMCSEYGYYQCFRPSNPFRLHPELRLYCSVSDVYAGPGCRNCFPKAVLFVQIVALWSINNRICEAETQADELIELLHGVTSEKCECSTCEISTAMTLIDYLLSRNVEADCLPRSVQKRTVYIRCSTRCREKLLERNYDVLPILTYARPERVSSRLVYVVTHVPSRIQIIMVIDSVSPVSCLTCKTTHAASYNIR
jgi:hypothetical protein